MFLGWKRMISDTAVVGNELFGTNKSLVVLIVVPIAHRRNSSSPSTPAQKAFEKLLVTSSKQKGILVWKPARQHEDKTRQPWPPLPHLRKGNKYCSWLSVLPLAQLPILPGCLRVNWVLRMWLIYYHRPDVAIKEYQANSLYLKMCSSQTFPQDILVVFFFFPHPCRLK